MSQTIDKINSCYPLFEQDEYQELFRNKRQLEEAHDAQRVPGGLCLDHHRRV